MKSSLPFANRQRDRGSPARGTHQGQGFRTESGLPERQSDATRSAEVAIAGWPRPISLIRYHRSLALIQMHSQPQPRSAEMETSTRFVGTTALVTGAARGIGFGITKRLHAEGANVVLVDQDGQTAATAAAELEALRPGTTASLAVDVSNHSEMHRAVAHAVERFGGLDVAVAAAGIFRWDPILAADDSAWDSVLNVNLTGVYHCIRESARVMTGGGSIVAIASINSYWMETEMVSYNVSKAGVVALVRSAALELAPNIRVNAIAPGMIRTPMTTRITEDSQVATGYLRGVPLGRFGEPSDVAAAVAFLASRDAAWITGAILPVDGGRTLGSRTAGKE